MKFHKNLFTCFLLVLSFFLLVGCSTSSDTPEEEPDIPDGEIPSDPPEENGDEQDINSELEDELINSIDENTLEEDDSVDIGSLI